MSTCFGIKIGTKIVGKTNAYTVESISDVDNNGAVLARCRGKNGEIYLLKCIHRNFLLKYKQEAKVLCYLKDRFPDEKKFVKIVEMFDYCYWFCFALEKLDTKLFDFVDNRKNKCLNIKDIRLIAEQMLSVLDMLKKAGIAHTAIIAENIELVNKTFDVKLNGFTSAGRISELSKMEIPIICGYSAPEILLNCPLDEKVDVWSLGCTLAKLCFGSPLFPTCCDYEYMRMIVRVFGQPNQNLLDQGRCTQQFFTQDPDWRLKTPGEYKNDTGEKHHPSDSSHDYFESLDNLKEELSKNADPNDVEDIKSFVDLLKEMLMLNPDDRISPADALKHRFITRKRSSDTRNCVTKKGFDDSINDTKGKFVLDKGVAIKHKSSVYCCENLLGCGSYGVVANFRKLGTKLNVAVKTFTKEDDFNKEVKTLQILRELDPQKNNIIRFIDSFPYKDRFFVISEMLDMDLHAFMKKRDCKPLSLSEIRPIAQQVFVALRALKSIGITHLDIKPDNIMLQNHDSQPFKVKLIDFGIACTTSTLSRCPVVQNKQYRAPEVFLGLPYDEGLDMWSVGCVLAFLALGRNLFPRESEYEVVRVMVALLGLPDKNSLAKGWRVHYFFKWSQTMSDISWTLKTPAEYKQCTGKTVKRCLFHFSNCTSLEDLLIAESVKRNTPEIEDFTSFVDLLKKILTMNPAERILPDEALNHPFITMEHLPGASSSQYVTESYQLLAGSQMTKPASVTEVGNNDSDLTESSEEMKTSILTLDKGVKLIDKSSVYQVEEVLGSGSNGLVAKCRKEGTDETVAVKVFRKEKHLEAINEANVHNHLSILDTNKNNLITFIDSFIFEDCFCLVFELLHLNLCDFLQRQRWTPLRVAEVRPIAQQMLVSLKTLKSIGLTHADVKPSSIMLVNHDSQPFKVKLIGFGLALGTATLSEFKKVEAVGYRAPEVYMGLPYDESIDTWGLGYTLVYMYLAKHLFPEDEYNIMRLIVKCCGMPDKNALEKGKHSRHFFKQTKHGPNSYHWRLKTKKEYEEDTGKTIPPLHPFYEHLQSLDDLVTMTSDRETLAEQQDRNAFVNLVKRMLVVNPADRILPDDALRHPFISEGEYPSSFSSCASETHEIQAGSNLTNPETVTEVENTDSVSDLTDACEEIETSTLTLKNGIEIIDESNVYIIEEVTGSESFGGVVRCRKKGTDDIVEIKIFRKETQVKGIIEINECKYLSNLDPSKKKQITFIDCFIYKDCLCLVYDPKK